MVWNLVTARILCQFCSFAFCIYLYLTITLGLLFDNISYLRYKNILHILAIVHSVIWITSCIFRYYLFVLNVKIFE